MDLARIYKYLNDPSSRVQSSTIPDQGLTPGEIARSGHKIEKYQPITEKYEREANLASERLYELVPKYDLRNTALEAIIPSFPKYTGKIEYRGRKKPMYSRRINRGQSNLSRPV